jgi:anti-sigma factor RsiW
MEQDGIHELAAAYALHALDPDDERRFEVHLGTCARCREEVSTFRETAAALAHDVDPQPPPEALERRILTAARAERHNVVPLPRRWVVPAAGVAAAAVAAAIALAVWATSLSDSLDRERSARGTQAQIIDVLSEPDARRIPTSGGSGTVVIAPTRKAVLVANDLPAAPRGHTYEAWVVTGRRPQPAGLFRGGAGRKPVLLTKTVPNGAVVGVTLERAGGVGIPTTAMVLTARA